jgi:hypothetical protein
VVKSIIGSCCSSVQNAEVIGDRIIDFTIFGSETFVLPVLDRITVKTELMRIELSRGDCISEPSGTWSARDLIHNTKPIVDVPLTPLPATALFSNHRHNGPQWTMSHTASHPVAHNSILLSLPPSKPPQPLTQRNARARSNVGVQ